MGVFEDLIFSLELSMVVASFHKAANPLFLGYKGVEGIGLRLHPGGGFVDDFVDGVETVMLRANILGIGSSQYVVVAADSAKDQLVQLAEHADFDLVQRTQMNVVLLGERLKLAHHLIGGKNCWLVGKSRHPFLRLIEYLILR
jgi:hypothetical protein